MNQPSLLCNLRTRQAIRPGPYTPRTTNAGRMQSAIAKKNAQRAGASESSRKSARRGDVSEILVWVCCCDAGLIE